MFWNFSYKAGALFCIQANDMISHYSSVLEFASSEAINIVLSFALKLYLIHVHACISISMSSRLWGENSFIRLHNLIILYCVWIFLWCIQSVKYKNALRFFVNFLIFFQYCLIWKVHINCKHEFFMSEIIHLNEKDVLLKKSIKICS